MPYLEVKNISKTFAGVKALNQVNLSVDCGEVLAIAGENGAGKSTLMKILTGVYHPDIGGELWIDGRHVQHLAGTADARAHGVCIIYQELSVVDNLTITENIFLSKELSNWMGVLNTRAMRAEATTLLRQLNIDLDPSTRVSDLSIGQKQMVEIAKAISNRSKIVIMDEPTASLSHHEASILKNTIGKLRADGIGIIYITHRLEEIFDLADRVTVLRDGQCIDTKSVKEVNRAQLVKMMVARESSELYGEYKCHAGTKVVLEAKSLAMKSKSHHRAAVRNCSFKLHEGEILGFFGLVGAGRTELMEMIYGLRPYTGSIEIDGETVTMKNPREAINRGLGFVTEDRKSAGLVLGMKVRENFSLTHLSEYAKMSVVSRSSETSACETFIHKLGIKARSPETVVNNLSGGNQQKIVIAKWVARSPRVLIVDEPTRGIDIAAKADVHRLLQELAGRGISIIVVSSDLPEVLAISDRIVVVREGVIAIELSRSEANQNKIMDAASA